MLHTSTDTRNLFTGIFVFIACALHAAPGNSANKITTELNINKIHANEPFKLTFSYTSNDMADRPPAELKIAIPACFKTTSGPRSQTSTKYINGVSTITVTWDYTLVPLQTGNLLVNPWSFTTTTNKVFQSDSFWVQVLDSRISPEDSLQAQQNSLIVPRDDNDPFSDSFFNPTAKQEEVEVRKKEGISFNHSDSIYIVYSGKMVAVEYSLSFVNVRGMDMERLKAVHPKKIPALKKLELVSSDNRIQKYKAVKNYVEYTVAYIVVFQTSKAGDYTIPPLTFIANGNKYKAPKVKVLVKNLTVRT